MKIFESLKYYTLKITYIKTTVKIAISEIISSVYWIFENSKVHFIFEVSY